MGWDIVRLRKDHDRKAFSCGVPSLDAFLHQYVNQYEKRDLGRSYVLVQDDGPRVYGYFTLAAGHIEPQEIPPPHAKKLPKHAVPVMLLGRLAVDQSVRGQGLGADLLAEATAITAELAERVGLFAVCVDALDETAAAFYRHHGFVSLVDQPNRLVLMTKTIRDADEKGEGAD